MQQDSKQIIKGLPRRIALMLLDCGLIVLCYWLAVMLRFDSGDAYKRVLTIRAMAPMLAYVLPIYMIVFWFGGLYEIMWEYAGMRDLARLTCLSGLATGIIMLFDLFYHSRPISGAVLIFGAVFNTAAIAGVRFLWRFSRTLHDACVNKPEDDTPLLIVGAGNAGAWAVNLCKNKNQSFGNPVCLVDDDLTKKGLRVQGVPVRGTISDIPELVRKYHIVEIVIAITTLKGDRLTEIINLCNSTHCRVRMLSDPQAVDENGNPVAAGFRELNTADFLSRDEIQLNNAQISEYLHDKVVLVTGGGGSIGSELCRQIAKSKPEQLIIFDIYENNAYDIQMELRHTHPELNLEVLIGSVRDMGRLDDVMAKYRPELVFHAAAHKHVPLMEDSPNEAIKNNVFGTYKMAMASVKYGVKKFVLISTDKAVNPTNIMGASKRLCEMVVQMMNRRSPNTDFVAVRFGNVLGSNGSVIPLFKKQIAEGGPVTVTHPEITRFFMTIPEAVSLVLQAGYYAKGGEIFILDMGQPVKIDTMARNLIRLSGHEPDVDIKIVYTGLRPGEKLYEEILMAEEGLQETSNKLIHIGKPIVMDDEEFCHQLDRLEKACEEETEDMKDIVASVVPTYRRKK